MQRQDTMLDLPRELLLSIGMTLAPEELISLASVSRHFRDLLQMNLTDLNNFWKQKFEVHFPDFVKKYSLAKRTDIDWFDLFKQEYLITYCILPNNLKKAVSIFKEKDFVQINQQSTIMDPVYTFVLSLQKLESYITYIEKRPEQYLTLRFGFFDNRREEFSRIDKEAASKTAMQILIDGQHPSCLEKHLPALQQGSLGGIFRPLLESIPLLKKIVLTKQIEDTQSIRQFLY
jgi:hypothetical protein